MVAVRKFLFETDFGPPQVAPGKQAAAAKEAPPAPEETAPPPPPTYGEEDMEAARQAAYVRGREEALEEAGRDQEQVVTRALTAIAAAIGAMDVRQEAANAQTAADAVAVAAAVTRKLFPDWTRRYGEDEIIAAIEAIMGRLIEEPTLTVLVNEDHRDAIAARIQPIIQRAGMAIAVEVVADRDVAPGDCRMTWNGGGAERDMDSQWAEIDEILKRNMDDGGQAGAATGDDDG